MASAETSPPAVPTARLSRIERRQRTRQRLIDAAIDIVRENGAGALTTVAITRKAGIHQPAFYAHFENIDECIREAAVQVTQHMTRLGLDEFHRRFLDVEGTDLVAMGEAVRPILRSVLEERRFVEVMIRHRFDSGLLGERLREELARTHQAIADDVFAFLLKLNAVTQDDRDRVEMWTEFILNSILHGCERLLAGRYTDVDELAGFLARDAVRLVEGELRWLGRLGDLPFSHPVSPAVSDSPKRRDD